MEIILEKLIDKKRITDKDIEEFLYDICEEEHSSCNSRCPVYDDVCDMKEFKDTYKCQFYRNGKKMLKHLRS